MSAPADIVPPVSERVWIFRLSRLNQRRLANFRRNRRGYWSFWVFWILFAACMPAEFIANDRPLIVHFDGEFYFPVLISYPETSFGGDFETEAEYRDPFVAHAVEVVKSRALAVEAGLPGSAVMKTRWRAARAPTPLCDNSPRVVFRRGP